MMGFLRKVRDAVVRSNPRRGRLVYAAYARCSCGAGLAHWGGEGVGGAWDCSAILLGTADKSVKHEARLPFRFYEILCEDQPSAEGATTRPTGR